MQESLNSMPPLYPLLAKALLQRAPKRGANTGLPKFGITVNKQRIKKAHLNAYVDSVTEGKASTVLPVFYPQVLCFPLHLKLMTHAEFPYKTMGIVHISNEIDQTKSIPLNSTFSLRCQFAGVEEHARGSVFSIASSLVIEGQVYWSNTARYLKIKRGPAARKREDKQEAGVIVQPRIKTQHFNVLRRTGLRYARVSGDFNPIHLSNFTAKLFGMPGTVVHGMWTAARIHPLLGSHPDRIRISTQFKKPLVQPATAKLVSERSADGHSFEVRCCDRQTLYLTGKTEEI